MRERSRSRAGCLGSRDLALRQRTRFADTDDICGTAAQAGFTDVEVHTEDGVSRFASVQAFLDGMTIGSPSTRHAVALLPEDGRARFIEDVSAALAPYVAGSELAYPMRTHILIARAQV